MHVTLYVIACWLSLTAHALDNGLASKPPMGWSTGERFGCNTDCLNYPNDCVSEKLIKTTADWLVKAGFRKAGYKYVLLGDCWMARTRDQSGQLHADPDRFPGGMASLVRYVHSKGMKIGLYLDTGNRTCGGFPGSAGLFKKDAVTLANWQVDMVKLNGCNTHDPHTYQKLYRNFGRYLNQTGRPILYQCEWPYLLLSHGLQVDYKTVQSTCNVYKVHGDLIDSWRDLEKKFRFFGDFARQVSNFSGPGSYMMASQLLIGDYGLSYNQQRVQMALWSIMASPLFLSSDVRSMTRKSRTILLNELVIAINQDPLGQIGTQIDVRGQVRIWRRAVQPPGSFALALLYDHITGSGTKLSLKLQDLGFTTAAAYNLTDVFAHRSLGLFKPWYTLNVLVEPTGVVLIYARAVQ